jgi:hypothetical protein
MTPAQLVKAVSLALDVPEETVSTHDRNLVIAGLRTTGARGRHAPAMTPLDAARLLVAVLGSIRVKGSVEAVQAFERTIYEPPFEAFPQELRDQALSRPPRENFSDDPAFGVLAADHNFLESIASFISEASAPIGDLDQYLRRFACIDIDCESSSYRGMIVYTGRVGKIGSDGTARYRPKPTAPSRDKPSEGYVEPHKRFASYYGVRQKRNASGTAIMLLGKAFRDNGLPFRTTEEALDALLGSKKAPAKSKKSA